MNTTIIESFYPLSFRQSDAKSLGTQLRNRNSVVLIGMKRVGISNFLRFFLYKKGIVENYIGDGKNHLFIPVDLNDLVEREIYPFWVLTLKRIADSVGMSNLPPKTKKHIETLFLDSIQSQDLFLTIDSVRKSLLFLIEKNVVPTIFLLRFDRMKDAVTPEFFDNLQGLTDATHKNLSFVFTSFRSLDNLSPQVFTKSSLAVFANNIYIKPASTDDVESIFEATSKKHKLHLGEADKKNFLSQVDGYFQYLQYLIIFLHEQRHVSKNESEIFNDLVSDERISLQSEELWESLNILEQEILFSVIRKDKIKKDDKEKGIYLWDTGFLTNKNAIFSPLFEYYIKEKEREKMADSQKVELSKKEHMLLELLKKKKDEICEREEIIEAVWQEVESLGVSDWAIDRLVARLRAKLKQQKSEYEIITVKTRGYKLINL